MLLLLLVMCCACACDTSSDGRFYKSTYTIWCRQHTSASVTIAWIEWLTMYEMYSYKWWKKAKRHIKINKKKKIEVKREKNIYTHEYRKSEKKLFVFDSVCKVQVSVWKRKLHTRLAVVLAVIANERCNMGKCVPNYFLLQNE